MRLFLCKNFSVTSSPNKKPAALGEWLNPFLLSSGSDQSRSQIGPSCGTSQNRFNFVISSIF